MPQLILYIPAGIGLAAPIGSFTIVVLAWLGLMPEDPSSPYHGDEEDRP